MKEDLCVSVFFLHFNLYNCDKNQHDFFNLVDLITFSSQGTRYASRNDCDLLKTMPLMEAHGKGDNFKSQKGICE